MYAGIVCISKFRWEVGKWMTTYKQTDHIVFHLELDQFEPGNIIFSDGFSVRTTDGSAIYTIAGSADQQGYMEGTGSGARFNYVHSFVQFANSQVLIADSYNHCLRTLDRVTNTTNTFAGTCEQSGEINGVNALLYAPRCIIPDAKSPGQLLLAEFFNSNI